VDTSTYSTFIFTDRYGNSVPILLKGIVQLRSDLIKDNMMNTISEVAPVLGCIFDKCYIDNDGFSLRYGRVSDVKISTAWKFSTGLKGSPSLFLNDSRSLPLHTDMSSNNNEFFDYFHIAAGSGFKFEDDDLENTLGSINNYQKLRNNQATGTLHDNIMSFKLERSTAAGVPVTIYFHEKGIRQSCNAVLYNTIYSTFMFTKPYVTARLYDSTNPVKCGEKYKLMPKSWPYNDTISLSYW